MKLYGITEADNFGTKKLKAIRECMTRKGCQRKSINKQIQRIRAIFRWAEANEIIERGMAEYLSTLASLKKGRCPGVSEGKKVKPAPMKNIEAIRYILVEKINAKYKVVIFFSSIYLGNSMLGIPIGFFLCFEGMLIRSIVFLIIHCFQ